MKSIISSFQAAKNKKKKANTHVLPNLIMAQKAAYFPHFHWSKIHGNVLKSFIIIIITQTNDKMRLEI